MRAPRAVTRMRIQPGVARSQLGRSPITATPSGCRGCATTAEAMSVRNPAASCTKTRMPYRASAAGKSATSTQYRRTLSCALSTAPKLATDQAEVKVLNSTARSVSEKLRGDG